MAVTDPSANYKWDVPLVGGDIGSWGGLLNLIFANELDLLELEKHIGTGTMLAPENPASPPPGIDQVVFQLQEELTAAEDQLAEIETRLIPLEEGPPTLYAARLSISSAVNIPKSIDTKIAWNTADFDQGGLTDADIQGFTIPSDGEGLWQFRASVKMPHHGDSSRGDDGRFITIKIVKDGSVVVGTSRLPYTNDGAHSSDSGDKSLECSVTTVVTETGVYSAWVQHGDSGKASFLRADEGTFFEAIRITKEVP